MKICHIISNKVWGGGEQYVYDLCRHLKADGHEVELLVRPTPAILQKVNTLGVKVSKLSLLNLIRVNADVMHAHNFKDARKAAIAKTLGGKHWRLIVTRHLIHPAKTKWIDSWLYSRIDRLIFVSKLAMDVFLSSFPKIDSSKICVVRNSICPIPDDDCEDLSKDGFNSLRKQLPQGTCVLMYHGRIAEEKGLITLVQAMGKLRTLPLHLFMIGTGNKEFTDLLQSEIEKAGIRARVSMLGFKQNVMPYVRLSDIGILPSIVRESSCLSCMEYMSAGKCVVTTNNGGQSEYITNHKDGVLVNPGDAEELADAITYAIENRHALGAMARQTFKEELSYNNFYKQITSIYEE